MIDLSRAAIALTDDGVTIDDPGSPWLLSAGRVDVRDGRPQLVNLQVTARDGAPSVTAPRLGKLPLRTITRLIAAVQLGAQHPNESHYRMLAADTTTGDHHRRVLTVHDWAVVTKRPGGGAGTVAEFWQVTQRTAYRWLADARRQRPATVAASQPQPDAPPPQDRGAPSDRRP